MNLRSKIAANAIDIAEEWQPHCLPKDDVKFLILGSSGILDIDIKFSFIEEHDCLDGLETAFNIIFIFLSAHPTQNL